MEHLPRRKCHDLFAFNALSAVERLQPLRRTSRCGWRRSSVEWRGFLSKQVGVRCTSRASLRRGPTRAFRGMCFLGGERSLW